MKKTAKKSIRPLSYGKWQGDEKASWCLKNYQTEQRPLYRLDQLYKNPLVKVLVVEGEKTADAAQKLFVDKNIVCVTWQGGSAAAVKSDWLPLYGREVIIWPDNDSAGLKAADQICSVLRQTGVKSLSIVDRECLTKDFPEKWDLADPLQQGKKFQSLNDMLLMSKEKSIGIEQAVLFLKGNEKELTIEKLHVHEILGRFEERLWSKLEEKHAGRISEIKQEILTETKHFLFQQENLEKKLQTQDQLSPEFAHRIAKQLTLQQAENGKAFTPSQVEELKQMMTSLSSINDSAYKKGNKLSSHVFDKSFAEALNLGIG